jgi:hypothetical protein
MIKLFKGEHTTVYSTALGCFMISTVVTTQFRGVLVHPVDPKNTTMNIKSKAPKFKTREAAEKYILDTVNKLSLV